MNLSEEIKKYRQKKGYSIPKLAKMMGIEKQLIYSWEKGLYKPGKENLDKLSKALNVTFTPFGVQESEVEYNVSNKLVVEDRRTVEVLEQLVSSQAMHIAALNKYVIKLEKDVDRLEKELANRKIQN